MNCPKCEKEGKSSPLFVGKVIVRCFACMADYKWVNGDIALGRTVEPLITLRGYRLNE